MPEWGLAAIGGVAAGGALVLGAAIAWFVRVPDRVTATIMAFGAGVLISALAFDLVLEAEETSGLLLTSAAFLLRFQTNRSRVNRYYNAFLGSFFTAVFRMCSRVDDLCNE